MINIYKICKLLFNEAKLHKTHINIFCIYHNIVIMCDSSKIINISLGQKYTINYDKVICAYLFEPKSSLSYDNDIFVIRYIFDTGIKIDVQVSREDGNKKIFDYNDFIQKKIKI